MSGFAGSALPLVCQPGERWMYHFAANVTGVLIARATGMSFGDACASGSASRSG
jgi:CubicO group peptidase (beta-lactamase class C family)